ncbi:MAG: hypothetical protein HKN25_15200 [Pyrinomonadaceae bacterium]|nr:hypothetical protein [Pyrinomonadaceae bacterium]
MISKRTILSVISLIIPVAFAAAVNAQPSGSTKASLARGTVTAVGEKKVVVKTEKATIDALVIETTTFKRLPPDNLSLKAAKDSKLSEISVGDQVVIVGTFPKSKTDMITKTIYLVKGSDLAEIQQKQQQEWRTRGISGRVTEVNPETKEITVLIPSVTGAATTVKVTPKSDVKYLRYAPTSVKYADAVESKFSDIQKEDMVSALGDKSEDGTTLKAEEILTGAFVTVAGAVKSIDAEKNEVTITDLKTKKDVTIAVNSNSLVKKFPERFAQMMAGRAGGNGAGGARPPRSGNQRRAGQRNASGGGEGNRSAGARRGGRRGGMDINQMLNRFPTITVKDLKAGDMIAASSPKGDDPTRLTAIKLLAGVEPFITMAQMRARSGGSRGGVSSGGFSIPGLDSVSF